MKKLLLLTLLTGAINSYAQTNYPGGISGCIARWDFASSTFPITSVPDVSGNGNNSSAVNNVNGSTGFRNVFNKAMSFNQFAGSSVTIPHATLLQPTAMTMVALVRLQSYYTGNCQGNAIITKGVAQTNGNYNISITDHIYDNDCSVNSTVNKQFVPSYGTTTAVPALSAGNYITSTANWYFVATTFDGTSTRQYQVIMDPANYIDNIAPFYTAAVAGTIGSNTDNVMIGRQNSVPFPNPFTGIIDEIALFNRALSTAEIQDVYDYLWGIVEITSISAGTNICTDQNFNVNFSVNNSSFFATTNTFTVQLSGPTGSFATPVTIGTITSTTGGVIPCNIPNTVATGTGYRIRIVANNVAYTTRDNGTNITVTSLVKPTAGSNTPICEGQTLNLTGSSLNTGVTYNWNGPGLSSNQQNPAIPNATLAHAGKYTLYTSLNGCSSEVDTETVVVASNIPPVVTCYVSPSDTVCAGSTVAFYALSTGGASPQYQWMKNGVPISGETQNTFVSKTLAAGDVIHCQVSSTGCSSTLSSNSNSFTIKMVAKSPATVSITANPGLEVSPWQTVTFTANATNAGASPSYQWKRNGADVVGATGNTWTTFNLNNNDEIAVVLNSSSECAVPANATSQAVVVNIKTSVDDIDGNKNIQLYPNPNKGSFIIECKDNKSVESVEVLNAVGQVLYSEQFLSKSTRVQVDVAHLPVGVYVVKINAGGQVSQSRIVIEK